MQYCSLQHRTLFLSPVTSTTGYCFCFGSIPSFFLELFLHWSPVTYWAPTIPGSSPFSFLSFCLFILFMGFSRQEYWNGLPFPSPVHDVLSELSTMTHLSWVALHGMALSFIELDKAVVHVIRLASCLWLWFQSVCPLMPFLSAYHVTWVSLTLDVGYLFKAAPAKQLSINKKKFKKAPRLLLLTNIEQEGQDKIYSPICKQIDQVDKNIWNNGFQITEFQAMKDSDTWEAGNKVRLTTVPYHCLKRVSRMCHRKREFRLSR